MVIPPVAICDVSQSRAWLSQQRWNDQHQGHTESDNDRRPGAPPSAFHSFVHGIKNDPENDRPSERNKKWLEDTKDKVGQTDYNAVK
jgi:hypothetical protein